MFIVKYNSCRCAINTLNEKNYFLKTRIFNSYSLSTLNINQIVNIKIIEN